MSVQKTVFLSNDPLTRKKWAKDLFHYVLPNVEFNDLTGTSNDSIVQIRTELGKGEGDTITFGIRLPLMGAGVVGQNTVEGNEEKLSFKNFKCTIDELNHAVDTGGKMEEQRIPYDLMKEGKDGLQDWWVQRLSDVIINTLVGNSNYTMNGFGGFGLAGAGITDPDVTHFMAVNQVDGTAVATAEQALGSGDVIDLAFLDRMKQKAEIPNANGYKVRPISIGGKQYYRVIMHNFAFDALRQNTNVGQWGDLLRSANKLQQSNVEIEYNGLMISKSQRVPKMYVVGTIPGAGAYRCVLCGAQAAVFAWGGAGESKSSVMSFVPYYKDALRYVMIRGGGIFGMAKTNFNSMDYGTIVGTGYAAPLF